MALFWPPVDTAGRRAGSNQRAEIVVQCAEGLSDFWGVCHTTPGHSPHGLYQGFETGERVFFFNDQMDMRSTKPRDD